MKNQKRLIYIFLIVIVSLVISACSAEKTSDESKPTNTPPDTVGASDEKDKDSKDPVLTEEEVDEEKKEGIPSPLSGIYSSEDKVNRRPVVVMLDNHPNARWQAGISQGEIVYEFAVEYPYTRYMAVFLINEPEHIGPIRSARPYFITTLLQYDPIYVRVGGSLAAKKDVEELRLADIDGLSSSSKVFWRYTKTGKYPPNNMYSSMDAIRNEQRRKGYRETGKIEGYLFNEDDATPNGSTAETIEIRYNRQNITKYLYDKELKVYKRYKDGKLHVDENDDSSIIAKNVIVQFAETKVIDSVGRLEMDLVGSGNGKYMTNGKVIDITWKKKSRDSKTYFYDHLNNELHLNTGATWIQMVKPNTKITVQ